MTRKLMWILALAVLALPQVSMALQDNLNPGIKNESSLQFGFPDVPAGIDDVVGATACRGTLANPVELEKIGLSEADLKKGIQCTVGNFDGNGYMDFGFQISGFSTNQVRRRKIAA